MHIGLNCLYLLPGQVGGTETYARSLIHHLGELDQANRYTIFANSESANLDWKLPANFEVVVARVRARSRARRYAYEQLVLPGLARRRGIDVLHSLGYVAPLALGCPSVVSVHDLNYEAIPDSFSWARGLVLRTLVPRAARRAAAVLTLSEASRHQIMARLGVSAARVFVVHAAGTDDGGVQTTDGETLARLGISTPYVLALSSGSPHKNIAGLLRAYALLDPVSRPKLVLAGHEPTQGPSLRGLAADLGLADSVSFTGYLSDEDLSVVRRSALLFVFPSFYEGFGIPVLDAMAAGVPVVVSNAASLPEVAGDAGCFVDPNSVESIADGVRRGLSDPTLRRQMIGRGREQAKRFSWAESARRVLRIYESVSQAGTPVRGKPR